MLPLAWPICSISPSLLPKQIGLIFSRVAASGRVKTSLQALASEENLMFYGHAEPYAEETAMARNCFKAVYGALNGGQKLLFQLQRICLPAKSFDITNR